MRNLFRPALRSPRSSTPAALPGKPLGNGSGGWRLRTLTTLAAAPSVVPEDPRQRPLLDGAAILGRKALPPVVRILTGKKATREFPVYGSTNDLPAPAGNHAPGTHPPLSCDGAAGATAAAIRSRVAALALRNLATARRRLHRPVAGGASDRTPLATARAFTTPSGPAPVERRTERYSLLPTRSPPPASCRWSVCLDAIRYCPRVHRPLSHRNTPARPPRRLRSALRPT